MATPILRDVFLTRDELTRLRKRLMEDARAREVANACILQPARRAMQLPLTIPGPQSQRFMDYFDPATGQPLVWDPHSPHAHRSPSGQVFRGEKYDRAWVSNMHNHNANAARQCALAAALVDEPGAAERARALLLGYAENYLSHPPIGRLVATWGRVMTSALEEAIWSLSMLWTTELLHKIGRLSDEEVDTLRVKLFEPVVDLLWGEWYFIHNIRMWCNAAIGSIGLAFGDRAAIRHAIHGNMGYRQQLIDGFRADGMHVEGSAGYHAYGATAMLMLAEAMVRNGYEPYREDYLIQAMLIPVRIAQPDGSPPALNDYWPVKTMATRLYGTLLYRVDQPLVRAAAGIAFAQWEKQNHGPDATTASWNNTTAYHGRQEVDWLLAWDRLQDKPPKATSELLRPAVDSLAASGLGIVRHAPGDYLLLKCSKKGSGHDHHDKLSLIWWHQHTPWLLDMGTTSYGAELHENWFKHTMSHSTVIVDGVAQQRCDAQLQDCTERFVAGQAAPYPTLMPDVQMNRRVAIHASGTLADQFDVRCSQVRTMDYLLRPQGEFVPTDAALTPASLAGQDKAYQILQAVQRVTFTHEPHLTWRQGSAQLTIDLSDLPAGAQVYLAQAPIDVNCYQRLGTMLIIRQVAQQAQWRVRLLATQTISTPSAVPAAQQHEPTAVG